MLEKLVDCIDDNENLQLFITKANLLTLNIDNLTENTMGNRKATTNHSESCRKLTGMLNQLLRSDVKL